MATVGEALSLGTLIRLVGVTKDSGLPITRAASANQKVAYHVQREKPEEWPP